MIGQQDKMIRLLDALFPGVKIYLFGSRARGTHRPGSDIDIALDTGSKLSILDIACAKNVLDALNIPQNIDIVDMNGIPEDLRTTILHEGIIWKM